ncbi:phosphotransferase [Micromonospora sp. DT81.3]|uniref:phosphotransferase n=1 Tax=Micromonospora sp. DT81.3 TaxID=3416523 RepID=UPI003CEDDB58
MLALEAGRATDAAIAIATSLDLEVGNAVILNNSNKLTLRLQPCDVVARIALEHDTSAQFEIRLAQQLVDAGCPVASLDPRVPPRVYALGDFVVTLWTYYASATSEQVPPPDYAAALMRLHAGMRTLDAAVPHFMDRVDSALRLLCDPKQSPALSDADRATLLHTLRTVAPAINEFGGAQMLHGEPHPGNLLETKDGPLFIDLETCCRGPVEFDLAHAPEAVSDYYPTVNTELLRQCRLIALALATTWRWDRDDKLPHGRQLAAEWLEQLHRTSDLAGDENLDSGADRRPDDCSAMVDRSAWSPVIPP